MRKKNADKGFVSTNRNPYKRREAMNLVKLALFLPCIFLLGCEAPKPAAPQAFEAGPSPVVIGSSKLISGDEQEKLTCDTASCDVLIRSTLNIVGLTLKKQPEVLMYAISDLNSKTSDATCFGSLVPLTAAGNNHFEARVRKPVDADMQFILRLDVSNDEFPWLQPEESVRGKIKNGSQKVVFDYTIGLCPELSAELCPTGEEGSQPMPSTTIPADEYPMHPLPNLPACAQ